MMIQTRGCSIRTFFAFNSVQIPKISVYFHKPSSDTEVAVYALGRDDIYAAFLYYSSTVVSTWNCWYNTMDQNSSGYTRSVDSTSRPYL